MIFHHTPSNRSTYISATKAPTSAHPCACKIFPAQIPRRTSSSTPLLPQRTPTPNTPLPSPLFPNNVRFRRNASRTRRLSKPYSTPTRTGKETLGSEQVGLSFLGGRYFGQEGWGEGRRRRRCWKCSRRGCRIDKRNRHGRGHQSCFASSEFKYESRTRNAAVMTGYITTWNL